SKTEKQMEKPALLNQRNHIGFGGKKPAAVCAAVYGAEEGDTCTSVSEMFNLSFDFFLSINPNINCDNFFVGQWLCTAGSAN
ncbi:hypothetical protein Prudu_009976, partial [Prunus dulcis]